MINDHNRPRRAFATGSKHARLCTNTVRSFSSDVRFETEDNMAEGRYISKMRSKNAFSLESRTQSSTSVHEQ